MSLTTPVHMFAVGAALALLPNFPSGRLQVGEMAQHRFKQTPVNGLGLKSLEELRGKPVLVAYWGHTTWADGWPADLIVWQKEYGDDLAIIFVEMQGANQETMEAVALKKKWLGSRAVWTAEYVANTGQGGLPQYSLLSNEGKLIARDKSALMGCEFLQRKMDALEDAISKQVSLRQKGPDGIPSAVSKLWLLYSKGKIGKAFEGARVLADDESTEVGAAARSALTEFEFRMNRLLARGSELLKEGRLAELEREMGQLPGELAGEADLLARCEAILNESRSDANASERKAAEGLAKLQKKLDKKGANVSNLKALKRIAKGHPGTRSAARAEHLIRLAEIK